MSDIIRLLPDSVANQIAAGEVIQRPASVIKELVENAVDAGAGKVEVIVKDAGRTLIQVVDDGCGMSDTDARMAFERHATSKILKADDLFSLHTMGFRGEALASICAVAQVELRTRTAASDIGTRLLINGSKVECQEPVACAQGSNMMVKNLFFNVPARRKFLKKDAVEFANIAREFERMAMVNCDVDMTLIHNDAVVHQLLKGSLKQRISDLFGKSVEKQLIPVSTSTSIVRIDGFVGMPQQARRRNALQYLTVNGRHMRHPYFHKAVMQCYEPLIPGDHQPNYFLNFTVDPSTIDVNIHPTKNEIKFENESAIRQILVAAVKESLGRFNAMPGIDFDSQDSFEIPVFNPNVNGEHSVEIDTSYNPFAGPAPTNPVTSTAFRASAGGSGYKASAVTRDWDKLYEGFISDTPGAAGSERESTLIDTGDEPEQEVSVLSGDDSTIQVCDRYILAPSRSGVMVIDQHRAHVKVLFERYREALHNGNAGMQQVLFPDVLHLTPAQNEIVLSLRESICAMGFDISFLGDNAWSIVAVPSLLGDINPSEILMKTISDASADIVPDSDGLVDRFALSMARGAAITAGHRLTPPERDKLLSDLLRLPAPNYTPDGLPVIQIISEADLGKLF